MRNYYSSNKGYRDSKPLQNVKCRYGITAKQYSLMLSEQDNLCAICVLPFSRFKHGAHVDHCHTTGKVRGLLCHGCNVGLGYFRDSIPSLKSAIKYLQKAG